MSSETPDETNLRTLVLRNAYILLLSIAVYCLSSRYYKYGLNRYPGPFLAKFTKFWHRQDMLSNRHQLNLVDLHRKYGSVVRIGPDALSISDPEYVPKVYGVSSGFRKSDMYDVFAFRVGGKTMQNLLSVRDPIHHAALSKPMAKEFAVSVISDYEPIVDKTLDKWVQALDERFCKQSQPCDMAIWGRLYAQESIMDVTFSESIGFLEKGGDVEGFLHDLDTNTDRSGAMTPMPWLATIVKHNPLIGLFRKDSNMFAEWARKRVASRISAQQSPSTSTETTTNLKDKHGRPLPDFLDRFLAASAIPTPPGLNYPLLMQWCMVNIMAGGDTTAVWINSTIYHILKHPKAQKALVRELRMTILSTPPTWKECQALPYLDGCVREGLRLHPPIGQGFERDTPGLTMPDGYVLPAGVKVGMNSWVVNRQASAFGEHVDEFVPERWHQRENESDEAYQARFHTMRRAGISFGSGERECSGKYVAAMETYKVIATLFREFDVRLVNPEQEWRGVNRWLTRVTDIHCYLSRPA